MANAVTDELSLMCARFEEAEVSTRDARDKSERDRDYIDLKQWTAAETKKLQDRNQPVITFDRTKRKINALLGLEKQTRKDPKAFPRNPVDEGAAHAATDAIRYVCDASRWDDVRSMAAENLAVEGTGAVKVWHKRTRDGLDPNITRIAWDRFFADPHSAEFDFSDASYMGEVIWLDLDSAKVKFPGKDGILETTLSTVKASDTYDDKPKALLWADPARRRVRIVEMYYLKGGEWQFCIFTKAGFLVDPMPSPYLDEEGRPECPIKAVSLYVDRDNNRYGEVRAMIGPQDEINRRRSKALHLMNERQVRVSPTLNMSANKIRQELSNPRGVIVGEQGDIEILPTNDMALANLQMLQEAKAEIDLLGPNAALAGKNENDMSGRAIIAQQQGGMVEAATFLDRVRCLSLAVYRSVWARVRQYWDAERWVRVTDNQNNVKFVGLNRQVTALEDAAARLGVTRDNFQQFAEANPQQAQQLAAFASTPMASQVVRVENNVAEIDVDITIDEGMDTPTIAAEQFDTIAKMLPSAPPQFAPALWEAMFENSALRDKDKIVEKFQQGPPPEAQQLQQQAAQIQLEGAAADVDETKSKTVLNLAKARKESAAPMIDAMRAGAMSAAQPGL